MATCAREYDTGGCNLAPAGMLAIPTCYLRSRTNDDGHACIHEARRTTKNCRKRLCINQVGRRSPITSDDEAVTLSSQAHGVFVVPLFFPSGPNETLSFLLL